MKSQVETSFFMCCFRYYSEEPADTALRSPGSQYHQRENPAVSLFLLRWHDKEIWDGRALSVVINDCIIVCPSLLINFVFSLFFLCYVIISKYLYLTKCQAGKATFLRQKAAIVGGVAYKVVRSLQKKLMNVPISRK